MRQPIRVAIVTPDLCLDCLQNARRLVWIGMQTCWADCLREDCDNHRRGPRPLPPPMPNTPPFELPSPE